MMAAIASLSLTLTLLVAFLAHAPCVISKATPKVDGKQAFLAAGLWNYTPAGKEILRFRYIKHGRGYDDTTGKFTAFSTGNYLVTFSLTVGKNTKAGGHVGAFLFLDDAPYLFSSLRVDDDGDLDSLTLTAVVALKQHQTLDVRAGYDDMLIDSYPIFSAALL